MASILKSSLQHCAHRMPQLQYPFSTCTLRAPISHDCAKAMAKNSCIQKPMFFLNRFICCSTASQQPTTAPPGDRSYPQEPRVGVGVVVFRRPETAGKAPDLLLIRRAKEPSKGLWCFPGGSQELGETLAQCAEREVAEETGIIIQNSTTVDLQVDEEGISDQLVVPTSFAAVDAIYKDKEGALKYHYSVIEVAALVSPAHSHCIPQAADDVSDAMWYPADKIRDLPELTPMCARVTEEAMQRFPIVTTPVDA